MPFAGLRPTQASRKPGRRSFALHAEDTQPRLCQGVAKRMIGSYMLYLQLALEFLLECLMNLLNVE
jgi:hypothetical protein